MKKDQNVKTAMLDGNEAATEALKLARVQVISAYPITPQSPISEILAEATATGTLDAEYIRVESEHSALSCAIGAQLTGVRTATATSSVGLALMHEVLGVASGCRVPIVMPVVNRALVSPWSLWCDHQDSMSVRDSGWMQFYAENVQEVLDFLLTAYKVAEHKHVLLPAMVCLDGFYLSHSPSRLRIPHQDAVDRFLPKYKAENLFLDPAKPMFINNLTSPDEFSEMRYQQKSAFDNALKVIPEIQGEYGEQFGRNYDMVETYHCQDADVALVTMGSMAGTAKHCVRQLHRQGKKVGVVKINVFRPFPCQSLLDILQGIKMIGVLDRSAALGAQAGPVYLEVAALLKNIDHVEIAGFILGLGGRDITEKTIYTVFSQLLEATSKRKKQIPSKQVDRQPHSQRPASWIDTDTGAGDLRHTQQGECRGGGSSEELVANGVNTCAGCGLELAIRVVMDVLGENTVIVIPPGCAALFSGYGDETAMKIPGFQGNLENTAAYAGGIRKGFDIQKRDDTTVLAFAGDGATVDIGLQALSGAFERGERIVYVCYDNEAYMNTGRQGSGSTPQFASTTTTPGGKTSLKKNMLEIVAAHKIPYCASASIANIKDLKKKIKKARDAQGPSYIHIHTPCPTGWGFETNDTIKVAKMAVATGAWQLTEIYDGNITEPQPILNKKPIKDYLSLQKRFKNEFST